MPVSSWVIAVLHGLDKDGVAINFHHNHDVLFALQRSDVRLGVHIVHFPAMEVWGVACFQWHRLCFDGPYVFLLWFRCPFTVLIVSG